MGERRWLVSRMSVNPAKTFACLCAVLALAGCGGSSPAPVAKSARYDDLVALFKSWRAFQPAPLVNGVPDYRPEAMAAQQRSLRTISARLAAIDPRRLARAAAGRLPHRARRDERPRLRPSRAAAVGEQSSLLHDVLHGRERSARARGPLRAPAASTLWSYTFPLVAATDAPRSRAGLARDPAAARAGEDEPRRATARICGPTAPAVRDAERRRSQAFAAKLARCASVQGSRHADARRRRARRRTSSRRGLESQAATKIGSVRHRRRELRLVPEERRSSCPTPGATR